MNVLRFLVCFAAVSFQMSLVTAHDEQHEEEIAEIGYVSYERQEYEDKIDGGVQLADFFRVDFEGSDLWETLESFDWRDFLVSLFMYDSRDKVWVEASAKKDGEEHIIYVWKPLLGYDLLKSSGCEEKELKEQPFTKERWGFKEKEEVIPTCYLLTLSYKDLTASQMYPNNCVEDRTAKDKDLEEDEEVDDSHGSNKRNTYSTSVTKLIKKKIGNRRKFVCKASHTFSGASMSLNSPFIEATAKIYYKPNNNADWGNHLLDLSWDQYSGGEDSYVSWVSQQHLNQQGVKWGKCFKCEVTVGGAVVRRCRGGCSCD